MGTICKTILFFMLISVSSGIYSQNNREEIILNISNNIDERDLTDNNENRRDFELYSLLPTVFYSKTKELIITSTNVTLENVSYYIIDVADTVLHSGVLFLQKDVEEVIYVSTLYLGRYTIVIEIDGVMFYGEFDIQ